jgi:hypothetical protein
MDQRPATPLWRTISERIAAVETSLSRKSNVLTFLIVFALRMLNHDHTR